MIIDCIDTKMFQPFHFQFLIYPEYLRSYDIASANFINSLISQIRLFLEKEILIHLVS